MAREPVSFQRLPPVSFRARWSLVDIYVGVDAIPTGNKFATHKGGNPFWTRPEVMAELMEAHAELKKSLGET